MKIRNKTIILLVGIAALIFFTINVAAAGDSSNDIWHQKWTGSAYSWEAYSESKNNIDISDVSYSIDGTTATLTMTTVGPMTPNTENVVYTMHLKSSDSAYYMIVYSNGEGGVVGMGEYAGFGSELENPIAGNKFTASFEISNPDATYSIVGFNVEHSDPDAEHGEAWWDYAPNTVAPYYSANGGNGEQNGTPAPNTPGFELLVLIISIGTIIFIFKRK